MDRDRRTRPAAEKAPPSPTAHMSIRVSRRRAAVASNDRLAHPVSLRHNHCSTAEKDTFEVITQGEKKGPTMALGNTAFLRIKLGSIGGTLRALLALLFFISFAHILCSYRRRDKNESFDSTVSDYVTPSKNNTYYSSTRTMGSSADDMSVVATEAVVVITKLVTKCIATRLQHLIETVQTNMTNGPKRDVWVLHAHWKYNKTDPRVRQAEWLMKNITGLKNSSQNREGKRSFLFDGLGGTGRTSFLHFVVEHGYSNAWFLEDDVYYTGPWREVFDSIHSMSTDVVPVRTIIPQKSWWDDGERKRCTIYERSCKEIVPVQTMWMFMRVSHAFAKTLQNDLMMGEIDGHPEALTFAYSRFRNFTLEPLDSGIIGHVEAGGWGKYIEMPVEKTSKLEQHNPIPSHLYHPVKCSAYEKETPGSGPWTVL